VGTGAGSYARRWRRIDQAGSETGGRPHRLASPGSARPHPFAIRKRPQDLSPVNRGCFAVRDRALNRAVQAAPNAESRSTQLRSPPYQGGALLYQIRQQKYSICRYLKPSDGLEPSTPSLPWRISSSAEGSRRPASRLVFRGSMRLRGSCRPLPRDALGGPEERGTCPQDLSPNRSLAGKRLVGAVARRVVAP
jgi:hypothetical protein